MYLFTFLGQGIYLHVTAPFCLHQLESQDLFIIFHLSYNFTTNVSLQDTFTSNFTHIYIYIWRERLIRSLTAISTGRYCSLSNRDTQSIETKKKYLEVIYEDIMDVTVIEIHEHCFE